MASWTNQGVYEAVTLSTGSGLDMRALLVTSVPAASTVRDWNVVADVTDEVDVGDVASYQRQTLTGFTITEDDTFDQVVVTFDDVGFGALEIGATITGLVVYRHVTNDSDSPVWFLAELATPAATNGAGYTIAVPAVAAGGAAYIAHA